MFIQTALRWLAQPMQAVHGVEEVRPRRDSEHSPRAPARPLGPGRDGALSEPAAVLHFGSRALDLARSSPEARAEPNDPRQRERELRGRERAAESPSPTTRQAESEAARISRKLRAQLAADRYVQAQALGAT